MATIEERTIERGKEPCGGITKIPKRIYSPFGIGYYLGATEQREIDIEKACEWLCNNAYFKPKGFLVDEFRKAMMEE